MSRSAAPGSATPRLEIDVHLPLDRFDLRLQFTSTVQVTGVFGSSGAGKSSLLEAVAGIRPAARGRIALGEDVWLDSDSGRALPPERRDVGYVPQDGLLFPHQSVLQNLGAGKARAARNGHPHRARLEVASELLELQPLWHRDVTTLSGGERQRVALGRALCSGPKLLLLDEPLASLDLPLRRRLLGFLDRVREEVGIPILLVSHDPIEVQALCDEVLVIREGRAIAQGPSREVMTDPEVFPLALLEGYQNVLPCTVKKHGADTSTLRLGTEKHGVDLVTLKVDAPPGTPSFVGIPAGDVIIATRRPEGLSARNILPATVRQIREAGPVLLLSAELHESLPPLTIEITSTAREQLGLDEGVPLFAVIKASSCQVFGTAPSR